MTGESSDLLTSRRQDDGLAGRLRVEEPVGFLGLLEPPAVREEPLHVHLPLGDELGALGLALLRERPRPHQRDLPAQEIGADVERDLTPLADETGGAPRAYRAHRRGTGGRRRGGVEKVAAPPGGRAAYRSRRGCGGAWVETDDRKGSSAHRYAPLAHPRVVGAYVRKG